MNKGIVCLSLFLWSTLLNAVKETKEKKNHYQQNLTTFLTTINRQTNWNESAFNAVCRYYNHSERVTSKIKLDLLFQIIQDYQGYLSVTNRAHLSFDVFSNLLSKKPLCRKKNRHYHLTNYAKSLLAQIKGVNSLTYDTFYKLIPSICHELNQFNNRSTYSRSYVPVQTVESISYTTLDIKKLCSPLKKRSILHSSQPKFTKSSWISCHSFSSKPSSIKATRNTKTPIYFPSVKNSAQNSSIITSPSSTLQFTQSPHLDVYKDSKALDSEWINFFAPQNTTKETIESSELPYLDITADWEWYNSSAQADNDFLIEYITQRRKEMIYDSRSDLFNQQGYY